MKSPGGLAFRLLKVSLIVWIFFMFLLGASYASVLGGIDDFIAENEMYQQLILGPAGIDIEVLAELPSEQKAAMMREAVSHAGFNLTQLFASMVSNMMSLAALIPLLMFILKVKAEERDIRAELIIATPVSRVKYLAGYAVIAFASAVIIQLVLALGLYSVAAGVLPDPSELSLGFLLEAHLVYVPAQWVIVGAAVLLIGLIPRATGIIWGYFGYSFMIIFFGRLDLFPSWLANLTPIGFVPQLPMDETNFVTLGILTVIAAVITAAGFWFYRRRDMNAVTH
jgi:ABC-2 type transport system permease protein